MDRRLSALATTAALSLFPAAPAQASPPPLEAYGALPAIERIDISPNGDRIAYISVAGSDRKLHVVTPDGQVLHEVDFSDIKLRALQWADEDHVVASVSITMRMNHFSNDAGEFLQVVSLNVPQHRLYVVFNNQAQLIPIVWGEYGFSSDGGHAYGYFGGVQQNNLRYKGVGYPNLFRVDLDTGDREKMADGAYAYENWLIDPHTGLIAADVVSDPHSGEWRVEADGRVISHGKADFGPAHILGFGKHGASLLISEPTSGEDDVHQLLSDGSHDTDLPGASGAMDLTFDREHRWIGQQQEGDSPKLQIFESDKTAKLDTARAALKNADAILVSYDDDFSHFIFKTEGDKDPGTYWLVDGEGKLVKRIGAAYPDIPPDQVGPYRMISWKAADGVALEGVLTLPPGKAEKNLPLVVLPHGGPQAKDYLSFDWWAEAFASRGYAVFQPNYRGSAGYGEAFTKAGYGQWGRKMQTDISDGVAELAKRGVIDPKRACIVGGSYGGYAALAGVTVQQGLYRCAVSWGGVADLPVMLRTEYRESGSTQTDVTRYWRRFMGADEPNADLDSLSPAKLAARADAPILVMYGKDDTVVSPTQSQEMIEALKRAGKPYEVQVMAGEDHWLSKGATRTAMLQAAVAFVQKYDPAE
ncbi:MAG TPA: alpha/beta fold hydrolase [Caulobacteraceae bacterium]|nr:alpha/beta fold hydrolase [Caulobacteraceae bacterium]